MMIFVSNVDEDSHQESRTGYSDTTAKTYATTAANKEDNNNEKTMQHQTAIFPKTPGILQIKKNMSFQNQILQETRFQKPDGQRHLQRHTTNTWTNTRSDTTWTPNRQTTTLWKHWAEHMVENNMSILVSLLQKMYDIRDKQHTCPLCHTDMTNMNLVQRYSHLYSCAAQYKTLLKKHTLGGEK